MLFQNSENRLNNIFIKIDKTFLLILCTCNNIDLSHQSLKLSSI